MGKNYVCTCKDSCMMDITTNILESWGENHGEQTEPWIMLSAYMKERRYPLITRGFNISELSASLEEIRKNCYHTLNFCGYIRLSFWSPEHNKIQDYHLEKVHENVELHTTLRSEGSKPN